MDKAFPKLQFEEKEQLALSRYLDQLEPIHISFGVKQRQPKTMHEAVSSTLKLESYLAKPRSGSVSHVAVPDEPPVESIQAVQKDKIGAMQKLVERVEKLEAGETPLCRSGAWTCHPDEEKEDNGTQGPRLLAGDVTSQGTMLEGVPPSWTNRGLRGQGTQGSWHQGNKFDAPNMPNVHVNNIIYQVILLLGKCLKLPCPS